MSPLAARGSGRTRSVYRYAALPQLNKHSSTPRYTDTAPPQILTWLFQSNSVTITEQMKKENTMADATRARKIADQIKVIVASTIERRLKDPRLGFVTVTDVRVTGDLQHASIFYTVFGDGQDLEATGKALESAKGFIRSEVGKGLTIRLTPSLEFIADAVPEAAAHLDGLLAKAAADDARVAGLAKDAKPAGDEDPYKKTESEDED